MRFHPTLALCAAVFTVCVSSATAADMDAVTVQLKAEHGSAENGTAQLSQQADGLHVVLTVANTPDGVAQPAHIHQGNCDILNQAPQWPLKPVVDGKSETVLTEVKLADLTGGKYAINVHKSPDAIPSYVSCGTIK